jgi:malate dehydrogenase (oxaloacetate-decarboxylating)
MDYAAESVARHQQLKGKLKVEAKESILNKDDLSTFYTPGVAAVCQAIADDDKKAWDYTWRGNTVAVISDGTAVLGLGNIGPLAAQPVIAGKALLFKEFAGIDAIPLVLHTTDEKEIVEIVKALAPNFGGINLEDIAAPRCFTIEAALQDLGIPVMHDDQHGTAVVVLAGLINACAVTAKKLGECHIVINGAGAAGIAIADIILEYVHEDQPEAVVDLIMVDSKGIISGDRTDLNEVKRMVVERTNPRKVSGDLQAALAGCHIFIGVSVADALKPEWVPLMAAHPIIFAMANPTPEIMPDKAKAKGASVVATGRSDFPNQVNNVLAFPGIFRGALDAGATKITPGMLMTAALALAREVVHPTPEAILPSPLDKGVALRVGQAVARKAFEDKVIRL